MRKGVYGDMSPAMSLERKFILTISRFAQIKLINFFFRNFFFSEFIYFFAHLIGADQANTTDGLPNGHTTMDSHGQAGKVPHHRMDPVLDVQGNRQNGNGVIAHTGPSKIIEIKKI